MKLMGNANSLEGLDTFFRPGGASGNSECISIAGDVAFVNKALHGITLCPRLLAIGLRVPLSRSPPTIAAFQQTLAVSAPHVVMLTASPFVDNYNPMNWLERPEDCQSIRLLSVQFNRMDQCTAERFEAFMRRHPNIGTLVLSIQELHCCSQQCRHTGIWQLLASACANGGAVHTLRLEFANLDHSQLQGMNLSFFGGLQDSTQSLRELEMRIGNTKHTTFIACNTFAIIVAFVLRCENLKLLDLSILCPRHLDPLILTLETHLRGIGCDVHLQFTEDQVHTPLYLLDVLQLCK